MEVTGSFEFVPQSRSSLKELNRNQWVTLICLSCGNIGLATCGSLQAPFFPKEAEMKGTTPAEYGLVFGLFYLSNFVFSPICGKLVPLTGVGFLRDCGMLVVGVCFILFGFLDKSPPGKTFLALAYIIRITEGIGSAAFKTSNFCIVAVVFPNHMSRIIGITETMFGFGLILGPSLGSALYQAAGYTVPFISSGSLLLVIGAATFFLLPKIDDPPKRKLHLSMTFCQFLKNPLVLLYVSQLMFASSCLGFNLVSLEPHLRQFNLSQISIGLLFIIGGTLFAISSPIWGYLADNRINSKVLSVVSCSMMASSFTLIGPMPFFNFNSSVPLIGVCLAIYGIGYGGARVIAYGDCLRDVLKTGLPNDISTTGIISGTFTAAFAIGYFLGPTIGGVLFEKLGYRMSSAILAAILYLEALAFVFYIFLDKCIIRTTRKPAAVVVNYKRELSEEEQQLLLP